MKNALLLTLIFMAIISQSCDERIMPKTPSITNENPPVPPTPSTTIEILSAKSWQYNEVLIRGGGKTVDQFSRPNSIGLGTDFAFTKLTYKSGGIYEKEFKGSIDKGAWELSRDEKILKIKDSNGAEATFDVVTISRTKLEIAITTKKESFPINADWLAKLSSVGMPNTITEFTVVFSFVPI
jgi:hypothetical protein